MFDLKGKKVFIAGSKGMAGSAIARRLLSEDCHIQLDPGSCAVNYEDREATYNYLNLCEPDVVVIAAAKVGGIGANDKFPADFITKNLRIQTNLIEASHFVKVKKLLFLGSSCIYPKYAPNPISEGSLLTGFLEPTNEAYAVAKIAGIKMCEAYRKQYGDDFITAMPTNLYGPRDNYDKDSSHVVAALIGKIHWAKQLDIKYVELWGDGSPIREFLYVDDMADACVFLLKNYSGMHPLNVGTGVGTRISELATILADIIGYTGKFIYDTTKPNGTPMKVMDVSILRVMGWTAPTNLREGLSKAYQDFLTNH